ncbi:MAG: hypothetical protein NUV88_02390 [Candidatus Kaiserbacteria bacterium]|nr:hypothetical protein [Candidatus Kaiserbacteria bacterium]
MEGIGAKVVWVIRVLALVTDFGLILILKIKRVSRAEKDEQGTF